MEYGKDYDLITTSPFEDDEKRVLVDAYRMYLARTGIFLHKREFMKMLILEGAKLEIDRGKK